MFHVPCFFVSRRHRGAEVPPRFVSRRHRGAEVLRIFFFFHVRCFFVSRRHRGAEVPPIFFCFTSDVFLFHVATAVLRFRRGSFHVAPAVLRFFVFFFVSRPIFFISRRPRGAEVPPRFISRRPRGAAVPPRFISRRPRGAEVLRIFFCFTSDVFLFHVATAVLRFRRGSFHVATAVLRFRRGSFHVAPAVLRFFVFFFVSRPMFFCFTSPPRC